MLKNILAKAAGIKPEAGTPEPGTPEQELIKSRVVELLDTAEALTAGNSNFVMSNLGLLKLVLSPMPSMHVESFVRHITKIGSIVANTECSSLDYNEQMAQAIQEAMGDGIGTD